MSLSFQDQGSVSGCYGCGADNEAGLQLKSYWDGESAVAQFHPQPFHCAGSPKIVYGGLLASLVDCHSCNLAIAKAYALENREIGSDPKIYCVTAQLNVSFLKPTPMAEAISLRAVITSMEGRKSWVHCSITANGIQTVKADVLVLRMQAVVEP